MLIKSLDADSIVNVQEDYYHLIYASEKDKLKAHLAPGSQPLLTYHVILSPLPIDVSIITSNT